MIRQGWPIRSLGVLLAVFLAAGVLPGCEKEPAPPRITRNSAPTNPEPVSAPPPTTQELLAGSYKTVSLSPLPLSAKVPASWERFVPEGTHMTVLQGPALSGPNIHIALEVGAPLLAEKLDRILDGAKKQADKEKATTPFFQVRTVGAMKVMEEQKTFHPTGKPQETMIEWKVTYFVRRDLDYIPYALSALGLSSEQFETSKELLRKIIDSVTYDAANGAL